MTMPNRRYDYLLGFHAREHLNAREREDPLEPALSPEDAATVRRHREALFSRFIPSIDLAEVSRSGDLLRQLRAAYADAGVQASDSMNPDRPLPAALENRRQAADLIDRAAAQLKAALPDLPDQSKRAAIRREGEPEVLIPPETDKE